MIFGSSSSSFSWMVAIILLPVVVTVIWNVLDTSPTLFVYDQIATHTGRWQHSTWDGKVVWVTGASSGIGAAMVCHLVNAGASHVIISARNRQALEQVVDRCPNKSPTTDAATAYTTTRISIVPYDAADDNPNTTQAIVNSALSFAGGNIDCLILNAGVYQSQPALQTTLAERNRIIQVNYHSPVELSTALIQRGRWKYQQQQQHKQSRRDHQIVVVTSLMAHGPQGLSSTYGASKAALKNYFWSLSTEEASWLRIDVTCPGFTDTGLWNNSQNSSIQPSREGSAMFADRVAHLILTGAAGPHWLFYETWIAKVPQLLWIWMKHYTPLLFHLFCHFLAYIRVPVWQHEQLDALDLSVLLDRLVRIVMGRYP